jgi:hypothetical protein
MTRVADILYLSKTPQISFNESLAEWSATRIHRKQECVLRAGQKKVVP